MLSVPDQDDERTHEDAEQLLFAVQGFIIPKEVDKDTTAHFLDTVGQFARIVNDTGLVHLRRLVGDEITGTEDKAGLVEKYFCLSMENTTALEDIELGDDGLRVGDKHVSVHTLSELDALPNKVVRTAGMKGCQRTKATASCHSPVR